MMTDTDDYVQAVNVDMTPILSVEEIPTRIAVHGTSMMAWKSIGMTSSYLKRKGQ